MLPIDTERLHAALQDSGFTALWAKQARKFQKVPGKLGLKRTFFISFSSQDLADRQISLFQLL